MKYKVIAYLKTNGTQEFSARSLLHAREMASRIVREGMWIAEGEGDESSETFFPLDLVFKSKIVKK